MPNVTFISGDGEERLVTAPEGTSLMQAAVDNDIDGIVGECGGSRMCATCHVYVEEEPLGALGVPDETELELLDGAASPRLPNSRLGCQITLTAGVDGLAVRVPERQY